MDETLIPAFEGPVCPVPLHHEEQIVMGHGSGGRMTHELIQRVFLPALGNPTLQAGNDFGQVGLPENAHLAGSTRRFQPIRTSSNPCFSREAISAGWQCAARSTTCACPEPSRCT